MLSAVCIIVIFRVRGNRSPSGISAETSQGAILQLIDTLISTNETFCIQLCNKTLPIIPELASLAHDMGAWVEYIDPFRTPRGATNVSLSSQWVVSYRAWNHCRPYDIENNVRNFDTSLFSLTKSLTDIPVAFSFNDLATPMELGEAQTIGHAFSLAHLRQKTFSQI